MMSNGRPFKLYTTEKVIGNGSLVQIQHGPATVIDRSLDLKSGLLPSNFAGSAASRRKWLVVKSSGLQLRLARLFFIARMAADEDVGMARCSPPNRYDDVSCKQVGKLFNAEDKVHNEVHIPSFIPMERIGSV